MYIQVPIFKQFNLRVSDLLDAGVSREFIDNNLDEKKFQKVANRVSDIMFGTLTDVVHQACIEQGIIEIPED